jgi:tRNA A58 N-methylase Trm61
MIGLLLRLLKGGRTRSMDPLQVSMTGVRMGERVLQIGCTDKSLLAGLAAKVGLSGNIAVAVTNGQQAKLAESIGRKVGALIDVKDIDHGRAWAFDQGAFDMVVVDDTDDGFSGFKPPVEILRRSLASLRPGGRVEIITLVESQHGKFDFLQLMTDAGFKPVRLLAEVKGLRFLEGLRPNS